MTTAIAERRLLEALAELNKTPGGLAGLRLGLPSAIEEADAADMPALADVFRRLDDLVGAVEADLTEVSRG